MLKHRKYLLRLLLLAVALATCLYLATSMRGGQASFLTLEKLTANTQQRFYSHVSSHATTAPYRSSTRNSTRRPKPEEKQRENEKEEDHLIEKEDAMRQRLEHLASACRIRESKENNWFASRRHVKHDFYFSQENKLIYLPIPKVGCSWWKRIFAVLEQKSTSTRSLFDISGVAIHTQRLEGVKFRGNESVIEDWTKSGYSSMFITRDPFSRLFSAYIDKMVLPTASGKNLKQHISSHLRLPYDRFQHTCDTELPFHYLCTFMVKAVRQQHSLDPHFHPLSKFHDLCKMNLTFLGKMETFLEDTKYVLSSVGVDFDSITGQSGSAEVEDANAESIMKDLTLRTLQYIDHNALKAPAVIRKRCGSHYYFLQKLWRVFQIRGMVSKHAAFPLTAVQSKNVTADHFVRMAVQARLTTGSGKDVKAQRLEAIAEAYRSVPEEVLRSLSAAFQTECQMFDYDCDLVRRFPKPRDAPKPFYFSPIPEEET